MVQIVSVQPDTTLVGILIASFTFIISLAWNDAFKSFFGTSTPFLKKYGPWAYALSITIIGFFMIQFISNNKYVNNIQANLTNEKKKAKKEGFYN